jgi:hypothetical protein
MAIVRRGGAMTNLEVRRRVNAVGKLTRGMEMHDQALARYVAMIMMTAAMTFDATLAAIGMK